MRGGLGSQAIVARSPQPHWSHSSTTQTLAGNGILPARAIALAVDMAVFAEAEAKEPFLRGFLILASGRPSHDTFSRLFRTLDPKQFRRCDCPGRDADFA